MKTGILLCTQSGEWQGLYVDGVLISEDHQLDIIDDWIDWVNKYKLIGVTHKELIDEDEGDINDIGNFYENLSEFKGCYL